MSNSAFRPRCVTCFYFEQDTKLQAQDLKASMGYCKRNPPLTVALPTPKGLMMNTTYPMVSTTQWCGEHAELETERLNAISAIIARTQEKPKDPQS